MTTERTVRPAWLPYAGDGPRSPLLICAPHAGGGTSAFSSWRAKSGEPEDPGTAHLDVQPLRLPARETRFREPAMGGYPEMAAAIVQEMADLGADGDLMLLGSCSGALLAFEIARLLPQERVAALIVTSHRAPSLTFPPPRGEEVHTLDSDRFWTRVAEYGGIPDQIIEDAELREVYEPPLRGDWQAAEEYLLGSPAILAAPIFAIRGTRDDKVSRSDIDGWGVHTSSEFSSFEVDGDHMIIPQIHDLVFELAARAIGEQ